MSQTIDRIIIVLALSFLSYLLAVVFTLEDSDYLYQLGVVAIYSAVGVLALSVAALAAQKLNYHKATIMLDWVIKTMALTSIFYLVSSIGITCAC